MFAPTTHLGLLCTDNVTVTVTDFETTHKDVKQLKTHAMMYQWLIGYTVFIGFGNVINIVWRRRKTVTVDKKPSSCHILYRCYLSYLHQMIRATLQVTTSPTKQLRSRPNYSTR